MMAKKRKPKEKPAKRKRRKAAVKALAKGATIKEASKKGKYPERHGAKQAINSRRTQDEFYEYSDKYISDEDILLTAKDVMENGEHGGFKINAAKFAAQLKGRLIERHDLTGTIDVNVEIKVRALAEAVATGLEKWWTDFKAGRAKDVANFIEESEIFTSGHGEE